MRMKTRLFLLCTAALLISTGGSAQKIDPARVPAKTVTLVSHAGQKTDGKSVFNFEYGVRGDYKLPKQPSLDEVPNVRTIDELNGRRGDDVVVPKGRNVNAESLSARRIDVSPNRRVRYDIRYGGFSLNGDRNWLQVADRRGARSVIKDMGEMRWQEVSGVPLLPASPQPYAGDGVAFTRSRGVTKVSPEGVVVKAIAGHVYVMHVKDERADYYVMLRVEAIDPAGECRLSWKRVASPER
jgi:hypothetical protein